MTLTATTLTRTTGWHELAWDYTFGGGLRMSIDGNLVAVDTTITSFNYARLGDSWASGLTGTNYFDDFTLTTATDSWENGGFAGWSTGGGTSTVSATKAYSGLSSFVVNEDSDWIERSFPATSRKLVSVRFYDDASDTTMECMGRVDQGSAWRGLGVDTTVSTTKYVFRVDNTLTASSLTRTTGWHELAWDYTSGTGVDMYVDGTLVSTDTGLTSFNYVRLGDSWSSGRTGVNYFDDLTVFDLK
jgi:hypothetical protein